MKVALFSRSIYPRSGGSAFVTEELSKNFKKGDLIVIGGTHVITFDKLNRPADSPDFYYVRSQISIKGRGERFFELIRLLLFPFALIRCCRVIQKERPTVILATFPDSYFCWLAWICSKLFNIPFFTYFHNTYVENRSGIRKRIAAWVQQKFFDRSLLIFVMSEGMKTYYESHYPSLTKFRALVHTCQTLPAQPVKTESRHGTVSFAFTGNFNESNLEATRRLVDVLKEIDNVTINFYTPVPRALLKLRGVDVDAIDFVGYLSREEYRSVLAKNDFMVLTHGFTGGYSDVEYRTIFPTRTIELLLTGKPIVAHSPENSFLTDFLTRHTCALVITSNEKESIRKTVTQFIKDYALQNAVVLHANRAARFFYGPEVVSQMKNQMAAEVRAKQ